MIVVYIRVGITTRFYWGILSLFILAGIVAIFTHEFSKRKKKECLVSVMGKGDGSI
jgi:hypothetical protein